MFTKITEDIRSQGSPLVYLCAAGHLCKFVTGVNDTCGKFLNKFETAPTRYPGAWGKLIHEKNLKSKILWHCPFKLPLACTTLYKVKTSDSCCHSLPTGNYIPFP
jgi:hypothetical protein